MAFKLFVPKRGQRTNYESGVTVSYRCSPSKGYNLHFCMGKTVADALGFSERDRADLYFDDTYGLALIARNVEKGAATRGVVCKGGCATLTVRAPWLTGKADSMPAERVKYRLVKDGCEITLPTWAYFPGQRPPPQLSPDAFRQQTLNVVSEDAAPPTSRDELEAKAKLRNGAAVNRIAREFGQPVVIVQKWYDEVMAEVAEGRSRKHQA